MAHTNLCTLRRRAFEQQRGFCHYCGLPIWQDDEAAFAARFGLSARLTRLLRSTAEHLVARCDGGRDERSNIVAACLWCNKRRHLGREHAAPDPIAYLERVRCRIAAGRWHPAMSVIQTRKATWAAHEYRR
jgi:5-methylcytosine-specific restriction endonuclease McrA